MARPTRVTRYVRRGVGARTVGCAATVLAALIVILAVTALATRDMVRAPESSERVNPRGEGPTMESGAQQPTPGVQTFVLTEADLNRWLAEHENEMRPASDPRAEISPMGIAVHVRVYGFGATYRARPAVENGRLVLQDARLEVPLGLRIGAADVTTRLQAALDERLAQAGLRPVAVELEPGALRVVLEPGAG